MTIKLKHPTDLNIPETTFDVQPEDEELAHMIYDNDKLSSVDKAYFLMCLDELTPDKKSHMKTVLKANAA